MGSGLVGLHRRSTLTLELFILSGNWLLWMAQPSGVIKVPELTASE